MAKMEKESNLLVTFSKRRSGLFKKASELCTLCGVQMAIIVFSPGKKAFCFGHPNVETIIDRYLSRNVNPNLSSQPPTNNKSSNVIVEAHRSAKIQELNAEVTEVTAQLEAEKKRGEALDKMRKMNQNKCWWENNVSELNLAQLQQLRVRLGLMVDVMKEKGKRLMGASTSNQTAPFMGNYYNDIYHGPSNMNNF